MNSLWQNKNECNSQLNIDDQPCKNQLPELLRVALTKTNKRNRENVMSDSYFFSG